MWLQWCWTLWFGWTERRKSKSIKSNQHVIMLSKHICTSKRPHALSASTPLNFNDLPEKELIPEVHLPWPETLAVYQSSRLALLVSVIPHCSTLPSWSCSSTVIHCQLPASVAVDRDNQRTPSASCRDLDHIGLPARHRQFAGFSIT